MATKSIDPDGDYYVAQMQDAIQEVMNHRFPPIVPGEDDDEDKVFYCPGCKQVILENHLIAEHSGGRKTILFTPDEDDWGDQRLWGDPTTMSSADFGLFQQPLFYSHFICGTRVSLPDGWSLSLLQR